MPRPGAGGVRAARSPSESAPILAIVPQRAPAVATVVRIVLIVVAVCVSLYVIYLLRKPLSWVFIAGFLAIALSGPVNFLSRFMPRRLGIGVTYLGLILVP